MTGSLGHTGKPITDGMKQGRLNEEMANGYAELGESIHSERMQTNFYAKKPVFGNVKHEAFAKYEFAPAFKV